MDSESVTSSSSVSTVSSALNESDEQATKSENGSSVSYDKEEFESESRNEADGDVSLKPDSQVSSSSEKYAFDAFEVDENELFNMEKSSEDDYEDDSFEIDTAKVSSVLEPTTQQHEASRTERNDAMERASGPHVGMWCLQKIQKLQSPPLTTNRKKWDVHRKRDFVDTIPLAVVQRLLQRVHRVCPRGQQRNAWVRFHEQSPVPTLVMQHAQNQLWIAKSCGYCREHRTEKSSLSVSAPSTFCSVKMNDLQGQLATTRFKSTLPRQEGVHSSLFMAKSVAKHARLED